MQVAQLVIKRGRHGLTVLAVGRTDKGQTFVKGTRVLGVRRISDTKFKGEMAAAVADIFGSDA